MVEELATLLPRFLGAKVHVQCFAHTVNLAARGVLHPFEEKKPNAKEPNEEVQNVAEDLERVFGMEELEAGLKDLEENGIQGVDDEDGFVDILAGMTELEREEWESEVKLLCNTLRKVI